jgi:CheY-like chemotaxis protein
VATILIAASPEPRAILERILEGQDIVYAETLEQAEQNLRERRFDLILCTILFDDSRMFDLLRFAKSTPKCQQTPFACARVRQQTLNSPVALEGIAFTCKALGAAVFLDIANYHVEPHREMREAIETLLGTTPPRPAD